MFIFRKCILVIFISLFSMGIALYSNGTDDDSQDIMNDPDDYSDLLDDGTNDEDKDEGNEDDDEDDDDESDNDEEDNEDNDDDNDEEDEMNGLQNDYPCCSAHYQHPHPYHHVNHHATHVYHYPGYTYHHYGYHYQPPCVCQVSLPKTCCCGSVRVRLSLQLKQSWDADYGNPTSAKYKVLKEKIVTSMDNLFESASSCKDTYQGCRLTRLGSPAVTAFIILVFQPCSGNPLLPLYNKLASGLLPRGLSIHPASLKVLETSIPSCARVNLQPPKNLAGLVKGNGLNAKSKPSVSKTAKPSSGTGNKPSGNKPTGSKPTGRKPAAKKPAGNKPTGKVPGNSNPPVNKPSPKALSQLFSSAPPPPSAPKAAKPPAKPYQPVPKPPLIKKQNEKDCEKETLTHHNLVRKRNNSPPVKIDTALKGEARKKASEIAAAKITVAPRTTSIKAKNLGIGESISIKCVTTGYVRCQSLSEQNYNQKSKLLSGSAPIKSQNYSQMVDKRAKKIGIGKADYSVGKERCTVLVVYYSPRLKI